MSLKVQLGYNIHEYTLHHLGGLHKPGSTRLGMAMVSWYCQEVMASCMTWMVVCESVHGYIILTTADYDDI